jgi:hypothetical protein
MTESWTLAVARDDLSRTTVVPNAMPELRPGEAMLAVDRVGMTANNVTYAVLGDALRYWEFFPSSDRGLDESWGLAPLWGFAEVVNSTVDGVAEGQRYFGYLPPAGHLIVRPARVDGRGFRDASPHRAELPSPYNVYALTTGDAIYRAEDEDLLVLFRPLFFTSFMLADQVQDNDFYGADTVVMSSASSKTAYGAAFELAQDHGKGARLIGLTSPGNVDFTTELGCYDEILTYDQLPALGTAGAVVYLDLSGQPATRSALRATLGPRLVRDIAVGLTNQVPNMDSADEFFFAPNQMRKRAADWGRDGLDTRFAEAWHRFASTVRPLVDVTVSRGVDGLRAAWLDMCNGRTLPRTGHVVALR